MEESPEGPTLSSSSFNCMGKSVWFGSKGDKFHKLVLVNRFDYLHKTLY